MADLALLPSSFFLSFNNWLSSSTTCNGTMATLLWVRMTWERQTRCIKNPPLIPKFRQTDSLRSVIERQNAPAISLHLLSA